jgi:hypothetical protein
MRKIKRTSFLLLAVLLGLTACLMPSITVIDPNAQSTSMAQTVVAMVAQTQRFAPHTAAPVLQPPAATLTAGPPALTAIPSVTPTQTQAPTAFVILTVTPLVAQISVSVPTNCRIGPGKAYPNAGALLVGETAQVFAGDPTGKYWYIANPDGPGEYCWVTGEFATLSGPTGSLPIFTPAPTPLPTFTETPAPSFETSYEGLVSCPSEWWLEIKLKNVGSVTFDSIKIVVKDIATDESATDISNSFVDNYDCSASNSKSELVPDKAVVVSAPSLPDDPTGHKVRTTITLCSDTDLNGVCMTQTITYKP